MDLGQLTAHLLQVALEHLGDHVDVLLPLQHDLPQFFLHLVGKRELALLALLVTQLGLRLDVVDRRGVLLHHLALLALVFLELLRQRDDPLHQLPGLALPLLVQPLAHLRPQV